jgi:hypothetical protein
VPSQLGAPGLGEIKEVFAGNVLSISLDAFPQSVVDKLGGKHWLKMDLSRFAGRSLRETPSRSIGSLELDPNGSRDGRRSCTSRRFSKSS